MWCSLFGTVHLLHSSQALVDSHFSYMDQGGRVVCVVEVLLAWLLEVKIKFF